MHDQTGAGPLLGLSKARSPMGASPGVQSPEVLGGKLSAGRPTQEGPRGTGLYALCGLDPEIERSRAPASIEKEDSKMGGAWHLPGAAHWLKR